MTLEEFREKLESNWGEKCDEFEPDCAVCRIHTAIETIEKAYDFIEEEEL